MTHSGRFSAFAHIDPSTRDLERDTAVKEKGKKNKIIIPLREAMSRPRFLTFSYCFKARVHLKLVTITGFNQKCLVGWGRSEQQHFHMTSALNELQVISVSDTCSTIHALFSSLLLQDTFVFLKIYAQHVHRRASHRKTGSAKLNSRSTLIANWQSC